MSTADLLLEQMFSWIEQREECAKKLRKLAGELESIKENSTGFQAIGSSLTVVGSACLVGAGLATLFTGGAAAPLLGLAGGVYTGVGVGMSLITMLVEHLSSSATMKDAKKIEEKCNELTKKIERKYRQLREEVQQDAAYEDADDLDNHIMIEIMGAMARRQGWNPKFIYHPSKQPGSMRLRPRLINLSLEMTITLGGILTFYTLHASGKKSQLLFAKGGQQLLKEVSKTGLKTTLKGGAMTVGGAIGLAFALPEAINQWKDLIEKNNVTTASQSLKNTADDLQNISRTLRRQLDDIKQMLKDFEEFKCCIENSNRTDQEKWKFIEIAKKYCKDHQGVFDWLHINYNTDIFFKLIDLFYFLVEELEKQKDNIDQEDIDITFVAHGRIEEPLLPASALLPLPSIKDVILYSPWNCAIDSTVAYGIAAGSLQPEHRAFGCQNTCNCQRPANHEPAVLPDNWNSMRTAGLTRMFEIPNILVSPLKRPQDPAWNGVLFLQQRPGLGYGKNRVVIPYSIPVLEGKSMEVPFYVVTLALSLVLHAFGLKATVHLAACLGRSSGDTLIGLDEYLNQQYSATEDFSIMTSTDKEVRAYMMLYNMLKEIFDL